MPVPDSKQRTSEERRRHIRELQEKLQRIAGGPVSMGFSQDCPDEIRERFLESVVAFEEADPVPLFDELIKMGLRLPAPEEMDDVQLHDKLWEAIRCMSLLGSYLHNTDHLSDRELYRRLWSELLREPTVLLPHNQDYAEHIDLIGSGSEEDIRIYLKHYADEEERERWAEDFAGDAIPPHEAPPFDRDRLLPQAPNEIPQPVT
jgi:hypothetical protein